jgi:RND family efflux transporter MFP subunit
MIRYIQLATTWLACLCAPTLLQSQTISLDRSGISGFTEPYRSIDVAAAETGTISKVEVLARRNDDVHAASVGMAKEKLDSKGRLHSAKAELNMQQERYFKLLGLFQRQNASQVEVDRAKTQLDIAKANIEAVQDDFRIASFEHQRAVAQLEMRRLRSPIDGVVTRVHKDSGEFVSASDPVIVSVVQLNPLKVTFSVPQPMTRDLSSGLEVELEMGHDKSSAVGVVEFVSPTTDAQSGTCRVTVKIDNSDNLWQSGDVCVLPDRELSDTKQKSVNAQNLSEDGDFRLVNSVDDTN